MTCECRVCEEHKKYKKLQEWIKNSNAPKEIVDTVEQLYSNYVHTDQDLEWLWAVVQGTWPSSKEQMEGYGWYKKEEIKSDSN